MATDAGKKLEALLQDIARIDGWRLENNSKGLKITNPQGASDVFHLTIRDTSYLNAVTRLRRLGYDPDALTVQKATSKVERIERYDNWLANVTEQTRNLAAKQLEAAHLTPGQQIGGGSLNITAEVLNAKDALELLNNHNRAVEQLNNLKPEERQYIEEYLPPGIPIFQRNRRISNALVNDYVGRILRGEWQFSDSIRISRGYACNPRNVVVGAGFITDGQHRIRAVIRAEEVPIAVKIEHNVDPNTFLVIDDGKRRSAADNSYAAGEPMSSPAWSVVRALLQMLNGTSSTSWNKTKKKFSNAELQMAQMELFKGINFVDVVKRGEATKKKLKISATALGCFMALAPVAWPEAPIDEFLEVLREGKGRRYEDSVLQTRDYMMQAANRERKAHTVSKSVVDLSLLVRCYNAWCKDESLLRPGFKTGMILVAPYAPDAPKKRTMDEFLVVAYPPDERPNL